MNHTATQRALFAQFTTLATSTLSAAAVVALAACGGGSGIDDIGLPQVQAAVAKTDALPAMVKLEGCVVDEHFIPRTGTPVRLLSADGRLLGNAISDRYGVFSMKAPARQLLSINVDKEGGEKLLVPTAQGDLAVGMCLVDEKG
jgi:hypothetical protein